MQSDETVTITPKGVDGKTFNVREIWRYRELLLFLIWRDLRVTYRQTLIGVLWVIIQPISRMAIFTLVFGILLEIPSEDIPYHLFLFSALIPWLYFLSAFNAVSNSLTKDMVLVSKVYFPRIIIPVAALIVPLVEFAMSLAILFLLILIEGLAPIPGRLPFLLFFSLYAILLALSLGLWFAAFNVQYRDASNILPFISQILFYATPIIYPLSIMPPEVQTLLRFNPIVSIVEGFRWVLLDAVTIDLPSIIVSFVFVIILLIGGLRYFVRMERIFGDVI